VAVVQVYTAQSQRHADRQTRAHKRAGVCVCVVVCVHTCMDALTTYHVNALPKITIINRCVMLSLAACMHCSATCARLAFAARQALHELAHCVERMGPGCTCRCGAVF